MNTSRHASPRAGGLARRSHDSLTGNEGTFYLGQWLVFPQRNQIKSGGTSLTIEPKLMEVLVYLSSQAPRVVTPDELIETCWPNRFISDNPLHKCVAHLRKALGDSAREPRYIRTVPRRGYAVVASVRAADGGSHPLQPATWLEGSPYRGLAPYGPAHRAVFFGRSRAQSEIRQLLHQAEREQLGSLFILGPGGVGKTSLVNAGLMPDLADRHEQEAGLHVPCTAWTVPNPPHDDLLLSLQEALAGTDSHQGAELIGGANKVSDGGRRPIVLIDQIERLLDPAAGAAAEDVFRELLETARRAEVLILATMRDEFYSEAMRCESFRELRQLGLQYDLAEPDAYELYEIITGPARAAGLQFETDPRSGKPLDQLLLGEARLAGYALPVISHALDYLYRHRDSDGLLLATTYERVGGIQGSLIACAEAAFESLSRRARDAFPEVLHLLVRFGGGPDGSATCQWAVFDNMSGPQREVVRTLGNAGLTRVDRSDGTVKVGLVHDSVLRQWPRAARWVTRNLTLLQTVGEIKSRAARWLADGKPRSLLLPPGALLEQSWELSKLPQAGLGDEDHNFIQLSLRAVRAHRWFRTAVIGVFGLMLALSLVMTREYRMANHALDQTNLRAEQLISFMMTDLKERLEPLARLDLLDLVGRQVIEYYSVHSESPSSAAALVHAVSALNVVGEVYTHRGSLNQALESFDHSQRLLDDWTGPYWPDENLRELAAHTRYWTGLVHFKQGDFEQAESSWNKYLEVSEAFARHSEEPSRWLLEQSYALNNLGTLKHQAGDANAAAELFRSSADLKLALRREQPDNPVYIADLADTLSWQAASVRSLGRLGDSLRLTLESVELSVRLTELEEDNWNWWHRLGLARFRYALKLYELGQIADSREQLEAALPIYRKLQDLETNGRLDWRREHVNTLLLLSRTLRHGGHPELASQRVHRAREIHSQHVDGAAELAWAPVQAFALEVEYALVLNALGERRAATMHLQQALASVDGASWTAQADGAALHARARIHLGDLFASAQQPHLAHDHWGLAVAATGAQLEENPGTSGLMVVHAAALERLGKHEELGGLRESLVRQGRADPDLLPTNGGTP